ncbi:helix-turn-helix domain-containing protein [Desulfosarcina variabilis]|uniref:helix-turn-helix domain-containing protein n=1 Tax=Desulfosarcina variabilis TaxID=2300 RepID=UPI003AFB7B5D
MASFKFEWQKIIASKFGPKKPTTRHVLLTLCIHMDKDGGSCFPSTRTLAEETGLSERSVCTHLRTASTDGWINTHTRTGFGQAWAQNSYTALIPKKVLKEVQQQGTERGSVPNDKGTEPHAEGTEPNDIKALKEVQSSSYITVNRTDHNAKAFLLKDGSTYHINDEFLLILKSTYPLIDVECELRKIATWCYSNESKRKTRRGAKRFVNSWMANAKPTINPESNSCPEEFDFANQFHEE